MAKEKINFEQLDHFIDGLVPEDQKQKGPQQGFKPEEKVFIYKVAFESKVFGLKKGNLHKASKQKNGLIKVLLSSGETMILPETRFKIVTDLPLGEFDQKNIEGFEVNFEEIN